MGRLDLVENNSGIEWLVVLYRNESRRIISKGTIDVCRCWCHWDLLTFFG